MNRRTFLGAAAGAGIASIAGCLEGTVTPGGGGDSEESDGSDGEEPSADESDGPDESGEPDSDDSAAPADDTDETNGDDDGPSDGDDDRPDPDGIEDGCPRGFAPATDAWSNREQTEDGDTAVIWDDLELACGEYAIQQYSPQYAAEYEYEVEGANNHGLEVLVMDRREFDRFREGESFVYSPALSDAGKNPSGSGELSPGEYVFVFDNSAHGESRPEGPIDATVEIRASWA